MKFEVFAAFISQLYDTPRYQNNVDGTATDLWHTQLRELIRGAERDTAADLIERRATARGDAVFVRFEGREVSYQSFNRAANRVRSYFSWFR